tara:strand:- start:111 stop:2063 length:1953 start_codon:yes stop_codon:yes gene_type:complete
MKYRKEIDGLRGIAVLAVIFYHAGINSFFSGGYVGVDVFFVISGYLITSIILTEKKSGTFTFIDFYNRRARRILPALYFVMLCSIPIAFYSMDSEQLKAFSSSLIAVVAFVSNILFFLEDDYFGFLSELKPFLHTWSLAVEEQFYIFFPPFLMAIIHFKKNRLIIIFSSIALLSILLAQLGGNLKTTTPYFEPFWSWQDIPGWAFYLAPTRAWELILGVLAAIYLFDRTLKNGVTSELLSLLGLVMILYSVYSFHAGTSMPGVIALIPTFGTFLLILFANPRNYVGKLLGNKYIVWVGLISYSAYLWHQPIFAFAYHLNVEKASSFGVWGLISLSIIFGYLSYRFIEKPFRNKSKFSIKQIFSSALFFSIFFIILGVIGHKTNGFFDLKYSWVPESSKYLVIDKSELLNDRQRFWSNNFKEAMSSSFRKDSKTKILIIGDSHAQDLAAAFYLSNNLEEKYQVRLLPFDETCIEKLNNISNLRKLCRKWVAQIEASDLTDSADLILVSNRWTEETIDFLPNLHKWIGKNQNKLMIVGKTAEFTKMVDKVALEIAEKSLLTNVNENQMLAMYFDNNVELINKNIILISKELNIPFLDRARLSCDESFNECSFFNEVNKTYYLDYGHWTKEGSMFFGDKISDSDWIVLMESKL